MDKVFLINKQKGISSYDVVSSVKRALKTRKVGHCGTLDPFADGLLIVGVNGATKIMQFLEANRKTYIATLNLGNMTDTGDCTGSIIKSLPVDVNKDQIINILKGFLGAQKQVPPMYSALKHDGVRLYELARQGIEVERVERDITIYRLDLISFKDNKIEFEVECSKGTYIRTLGEDIAKRLGTIGYLSSLQRSKIGSFSLSDAISIDDISYEKGLSILEALKDMPCIYLTDLEYNMVSNGKPAKLNSTADEVLLIKDNKPLAIYYRDNEIYRSKRGF